MDVGIVVAVIGVAGAGVTGGLTLMGQHYARKTIGKANGGGTVVAMVEHLIANQTRTSDELAQYKKADEAAHVRLEQAISALSILTADTTAKRMVTEALDRGMENV